MVRVVNVNLSRKNNLNFTLKNEGLYCLVCEDKEEKNLFLQILTKISHTKGDVLIGRESIIKCKEKIYRKKLKELGIVYSDYKFIGYKNVFENLDYYLEIRGCSKEQREKIIDESLEFFGIKEKLNHELKSLTHDEKVILGLARAMMTEPKYLIVEDIHVGTKKAISKKILEFLKKVSKSGTGVLYLTTDRKFVEDKKMINIIEGAL